MNSRAWMLAILTMLLVIGLGLSLAEAYRTSDWWGALLNLGPELIGAVVTYALFEMFLGRRMKEEEEKARLAEETKNEKQRLIQEMGSSVHDVAIAAVEKLRQHGWLGDGSLQGANLFGANLRDASLFGAYLRGANLAWANLRGVYLYDADLRDAWLIGAPLWGARLDRAKLQDTKLMAADLREAKLAGANLEGANLRDAILDHALYDERTILPDGATWTSDTDIARFADPEHPDFWRSDDPYSPAYRGTERE
jgi:hypothetical protein